MHARLRLLRQESPVGNQAARDHRLLQVLCEGESAVRQLPHKPDRILHSPCLIGIQAQPGLAPHPLLQGFREPAGPQCVLHRVLPDLDLHHHGPTREVPEILLPHHQAVDADARRAARLPRAGGQGAEVRRTGRAGRQVEEGHLKARAYRGEQAPSTGAADLEPPLHRAVEPGDLQRQGGRAGRPRLEHLGELLLRLRERLSVEHWQWGYLANPCHRGGPPSTRLDDDEEAATDQHGISAAKAQGSLQREFDGLGPGRQHLQAFGRRGYVGRQGNSQKLLADLTAQPRHLVGALLDERVPNIRHCCDDALPQLLSDGCKLLVKRSMSIPQGRPLSAAALSRPEVCLAGQAHTQERAHGMLRRRAPPPGEHAAVDVGPALCQVPPQRSRIPLVQELVHVAGRPHGGQLRGQREVARGPPPPLAGGAEAGVRREHDRAQNPRGVRGGEGQRQAAAEGVAGDDHAVDPQAIEEARERLHSRGDGEQGRCIPRIQVPAGSGRGAPMARQVHGQDVVAGLRQAVAHLCPVLLLPEPAVEQQHGCLGPLLVRGARRVKPTQAHPGQQLVADTGCNGLAEPLVQGDVLFVGQAGPYLDHAGPVDASPLPLDVCNLEGRRGLAQHVRHAEGVAGRGEVRGVWFLEVGGHDTLVLCYG
mmetsp:Transcript_63793/g.197541  ORF Transcript_63793/g.197541 Transcript_63793/m.197541 type:complete len:649 (-) Transcript_63793:389-2335(-)